MLENEIEKKLIEEVKKLKGLCLKLNSQSANGIPDRIILLPKGRIFFTELKSPGEQLDSLQKYWQEKLIDLGFNFLKIDSINGVKAFIEKLEGVDVYHD